ncbi:zinc finger MYND domain-containing protein [Phanerochaete sordida]|uniref:Zinc finger MYND domain-containing protein n=1 Tax=Phanerochaete sordida TaxID=48140 RepID=A0A9P3G624_9APHY|nr:zinc finger MYND domain-containing protein [Phanerochaete sordida]
MSQIWATRRPDMHTSRVEWEHSWQRDFDRNFPHGATPPKHARPIPPSLFAAMGSDQHIFAAEYEEFLICKLQHDIAKEAARRFAEDGFENAWRALPDDRRREVILEGIYRTMRIPDMEERRKWCPDSSLQTLAARGGEGYLRVLKCLLPSTLDAPLTKPIEEEMTHAGCKTAYRAAKNSRTYALSTVVWNILLTFYGMEETQEPIRPARATTASTGAVAKSEERALMRSHNAQRKDMPNVCARRAVAETRLPAGAKLQACSRCRALGRRVFYCSKECQTQDWTAGTPRPHRRVCGTPLREDAPAPAAPADPADDSGIPGPEPGFVRPPALLHQIALLKQARGVDYFVRPYPEPDQGICLDATASLLFTTARARAFKNGDARAVQTMYSVLTGFADAPGVPRARVRRQLQGEYGVRVGERG